MNMQSRSEERSLALHREIARKLRDDPTLWHIPKGNILKWEKRSGFPSPALLEWENILNTQSREQILSILESDTADAVRLRSSSPFTGILNRAEREAIFASFSNLDEVERVRS